MHHFIHHVRRSASDPVLLAVDGHYSHTRNVEVIALARANYMTIVWLPTHATHKLQPLDAGFMGPLKTDYAQ